MWLGCEAVNKPVFAGEGIYSGVDFGDILVDALLWEGETPDRGGFLGGLGERWAHTCPL